MNSEGELKPRGRKGHRPEGGGGPPSGGVSPPEVDGKVRRQAEGEVPEGDRGNRR